MSDKEHSKSVGLILGGAQLPVTRELIDEAECYSRGYSLPWNKDSIICANSIYGTEEIQLAWGKTRSWPQRVVTTLHSYLGLAQFLFENAVPENEYPEILVMVNDASFLPLPHLKLNAKTFLFADDGLGMELAGVAIDYISGKLKDNFTGIYDPVKRKLIMKGHEL